MEINNGRQVRNKFMAIMIENFIYENSLKFAMKCSKNGSNDLPIIARRLLGLMTSATTTNATI